MMENPSSPDSHHLRNQRLGPEEVVELPEIVALLALVLIASAHQQPRIREIMGTMEEMLRMMRNDGAEAVPWSSGCAGMWNLRF
jgi:hypothetical protein